MLYRDNPFYVLGASLADGRRDIVKRAEEQSLLIDSQKCNEACTVLTNPQRRISAEVHWFIDCDLTQEKEIQEYIKRVLSGEDDYSLVMDRFSPLTQLNAQLACIDAQDFKTPIRIKYYILIVSRQFEAIDTSSVLQQINEKRHESGFPEVTKLHDVDAAVDEIRSEIRQQLSLRLRTLPEAKYTEVVTMLAESYSGNQRYRGSAVLEDVIAEYQLYIDDTLQRKGQDITRTARFIIQGAKKIKVSEAVSDLIDSLYEWDKLAQPLQLGALTRGSSHEESVEMLEALRQLALKLHNEYGMSAESLAITKATQEVFKELPEYAELLGNDNETLTRLIEEKENEAELVREVQAALNEFDTLQKQASSVKAYPSRSSVDVFIGKVINLDRIIKELKLDAETKAKFRENLCYLARGVAIELHNTKHQTTLAMSIIGPLCDEFSDISPLKTKLYADYEALSKQMLNSLSSRAPTHKSGRSGAGWILFGIIMLAIVIGNSSGSSSSSSKSTSYSSTSTPKPTSTLTPHITPKNGEVFYCASEDTPSAFKVTNNGPSNYFMKFVKAGTDTTVITFFVRAYSTAEIDMPAGKLELRYAYGSTWYGQNNLFGESTRYAKDEEYYDFTKYTWEITLKTTNNTGQTMDVEPISANEF